MGDIYLLEYTGIRKDEKFQHDMEFLLKIFLILHALSWGCLGGILSWLKSEKLDTWQLLCWCQTNQINLEKKVTSKIVSSDRGGPGNIFSEILSQFLVCKCRVEHDRKSQHRKLDHFYKYIFEPFWIVIRETLDFYLYLFTLVDVKVTLDRH
jgi:hypothetical protein